MELFDENNNKKYTTEILINAYENLNHHNEFNFPDGDFFYVIFNAPKDKINNILIRDLFSDIYLIDSFIQAGTGVYEIAGFHLFDDNIIIIEYYGVKYNTQFYVKLYREKNKWYCTKIGMENFDNPICVNDFPNGYPFFNKNNWV